LNGALPPGQYSLAVSSRVEQQIQFTWQSSVSLAANCIPCPATKDSIGTIDAACQTRTAISGTSSDGANNPPKMTFLDTVGIYPTPTCDQNETNSVIKQVKTVYTNVLSNPANRAAWSSGSAAPVYDAADAVLTESSVALRVLNPASTFGFWALDGTDVPSDRPLASDAPVVYRARFRVKNEFENTVTNLPTLRFRLATDDFQRSAEAVINPGTTGSFQPAPGRPREVQVYLVLESVPTTFQNFVVAFDVLSFFTDRPITSQPIEVEMVTIERLTIPNYPPRSK